MQTTMKKLILTDAAKKRIQEYSTKHPETPLLRFFVKETGCSGFSYETQMVAEPEERDYAIEVGESMVVYIEYQSYPYLRGSRIDFVRRGLQEKFVFDNPNQTGVCGCGESFTVSS